jgi:hypothetical protein
MSQSQTIDRRRMRRTRRRLQLTLCSRSLRDQLGFTVDISPWGLQITSARHELAPGEPVRLEVGLPEIGNVALTGVVVWAVQAHAAVAPIVQPKAGVRLTQADEAWFQYCLAAGM